MKNHLPSNKKTYLICYDLDNKKDYTKLHDAIKSCGDSGDPLGSTWVVSSHKSSSEIKDELEEHLYGGDKLLIVRSGGETVLRGFGPKSSKWLKGKL